jgi:putative redox protein
MSMECMVSWNGVAGMSFTAETGSGHLINMDGAPEGGGRNLAPRPMELVLVGAGGCTAYDVVLILRKSNQDIRGCDVQVKAERAETDPKVFTAIHLLFKVRGRNLSRNLVERAVKLSHDKYCSATRMLQSTAAITYDIELIDDMV